MTVNTVDDALLEIQRLRAINQQLLAALKSAKWELVLPMDSKLSLRIEAAISEAERTL